MPLLTAIGASSRVGARRRNRCPPHAMRIRGLMGAPFQIVVWSWCGAFPRDCRLKELLYHLLLAHLPWRAACSFTQAATSLGAPLLSTTGGGEETRRFVPAISLLLRRRWLHCVMHTMGAERLFSPRSLQGSGPLALVADFACELAADQDDERAVAADQDAEQTRCVPPHAWPAQVSGLFFLVECSAACRTWRTGRASGGALEERRRHVSGGARVKTFRTVMPLLHSDTRFRAPHAKATEGRNIASEMHSRQRHRLTLLGNLAPSASERAAVVVTVLGWCWGGGRAFFDGGL